MKLWESTPTEPGVYLARGQGFQYWNLVVIISGSAPHLEGIMINRENQNISNKIHGATEYLGPIEEPEVENWELNIDHADESLEARAARMKGW